MKRRARLGATFALACALAPGASAQDATGLLPGTAPSSLVGTSHTTAFESYVEQPGRLLVERRRTLTPIALPGGAALQLEPVVVFEPAQEQERMLGVRLRVKGAGLEGRDGLVYLDLHEVEALLRGIESIPMVFATEVIPEAGELAVHHETLDGLVVSAISSAGGDARYTIAIEREDETTELPASPQSVTALGDQLDASRRFLFQQ